jgi:uncharacterized membrane protein YdbT with pleckstrin-like domain
MGNYIKKHLIADEFIVYETTYHWVIFFSLRALITLFIYPAFQRWTDEFVITNRRVVVKTGFISRNTVEINLNKVESVDVHQSIFGRLFDFGEIVIVGTGGTKEAFKNIAHPIEFRKKFQEHC